MHPVSELKQEERSGAKPEQPGLFARWWRWERTSGKFLMISIGAHILFGLIAAVFVVQHYQTARKLTFKGGPPSPNPSSRALEHKDAIRTDSAMAIAEPCNLFSLEMQIPEAVIDHHEVVARTIHLGETQPRHSRF